MFLTDLVCRLLRSWSVYRWFDRGTFRIQRWATHLLKKHISCSVKRMSKSRAQGSQQAGLNSRGTQDPFASSSGEDDDCCGTICWPSSWLQHTKGGPFGRQVLWTWPAFSNVVIASCVGFWRVFLLVPAAWEAVAQRVSGYRTSWRARFSHLQCTWVTSPHRRLRRMPRLMAPIKGGA
jgi:hypothetical protein